MWTFRAMNTDVAVAAPDLGDDAERELATAVGDLFARTERRFSRFLPDSELAALNRAGGPVDVSADLLELLMRARRHAAATEGVFEPAVGAALCASGYDRSFAPGALDREEAAATATAASIALVDIDATRSRVARPPHVQIDLGGFLKGLTADRAASLAPGAVMVDAGGDAVLRGAPAGEEGWTVDVEDPRDAARTLGSIEVRDGAVATSAANRRRWRRGAREMHHLIDPRTRAPAETDLLQATVIAPTAELADVMAKVAFVLGSERGGHELARRGLSAVLVRRDGAVRTVGDVELRHA
ncbi:MAG: FAD:protein FMN transferase [Myxococcales bacterium]|nr:FAD:protein FMN transferase [Myxococcales bacterium]